MDKISILELENLSTGYRIKRNEKVISRALNAQLHQGELTCLLGPNGCGKSTLLRTLAGFQPALGGDVYIDHRKLSAYSSKELSRLVSVVLTDNSGIRNMTAREVVAIGRSPYTGFWGRLGEKDHNIVAKCLQWVGITELADRNMQTLSDGERQKVMIAKAIAQETPIILLDEPTAFLDYPSKMSMLMLLHRLAKALKKTIFLSTHDLEHALQIADQVWLLDQERGLTTGMPEDLCIEGAIEDYFLRPGMAFDPFTATFSIQPETAREIIIEGNPDSLNYRLACRAFMRNALRPIASYADHQLDSTLPDVIIRIDAEGQYHLFSQGKETICVPRIEQLIGITNSTIVKNQITAVRDAAHMTPYE